MEMALSNESYKKLQWLYFGFVAELVDASDLRSDSFGSESSSLFGAIMICTRLPDMFDMTNLVNKEQARLRIRRVENIDLCGMSKTKILGELELRKLEYKVQKELEVVDEFFAAQVRIKW